MSGLPQNTRWTWDAYLDWEAGQELRHELIDGRIRAMTGGTVSHDLICNNLRAACGLVESPGCTKLLGKTKS